MNRQLFVKRVNAIVIVLVACSGIMTSCSSERRSVGNSWSDYDDRQRERSDPVVDDGAYPSRYRINVISNTGRSIPGVDVSVDGKYQGKTGPGGLLEVMLFEGQHTVLLRKDGYQSKTYFINSSQSLTDVTLQLFPS